MVKTKMNYKKETEGTIVYSEDQSSGEAPIIGTLYLKKYAAAKLGNPKTIEVTVTAGK